MEDKLLQELGTVVRSYYDNSGVGLEKTCKDIISIARSHMQSTDVLAAKNITELNSENITTLTFSTGAWLLVENSGVIRSYRGDSPIGVTELDKIVWRDSIYFAMPTVTIQELFERGNRVYLVKDM